MTNSPPKVPVLHPYAINQEFCQREITEALRQYVGLGKPFSYLTLSEAIGIEERTMKSYFDGQTCPPLKILLRLFQVLGAEFTNRIIGIAGYGNAEKLQLCAVNEFRLNGALTALVAELGDALKDGRMDHCAQARVVRDIPGVIAVLQSYHARYAPKPPENLREWPVLKEVER